MITTTENKPAFTTNITQSQWIHYLAPPVIGVCLYLMMYIQSYFERMYFSYTSLLVFPLLMYFLWWLGRKTQDWLEQHYSWKTKLWKRFVVQFVLFTTIALGINIPLYVAVKSWFIYEKIEIDTIGVYHLVVISSITILAVVIVFTAQLSIYFIQQWVSSQIESEKFRRESIQARFEGLKHQISPHFLFNSLNILSELIDQSSNVAKEYTDKLSEVYRYVLQNRHNELITLQQELSFAKSYVFLLQKRFGENLQVHFQVNSTCINQYLPPLTLQLLIENAVKHNVVSRKKPLIIYIRSESENKLIVLNNLQKRLNNRRLSTQIGLENLIKRYEYLAEQQPLIREEEDSFEVSIPLLKIATQDTSIAI